MAREMHYHPALYFPLVNEDPFRDNPLDGLNAEDVAILREYIDVDLPMYKFLPCN